MSTFLNFAGIKFRGWTKQEGFAGIQFRGCIGFRMKVLKNFEMRDFYPREIRKLHAKFARKVYQFACCERDSGTFDFRLQI